MIVRAGTCTDKLFTLDGLDAHPHDRGVIHPTPVEFKLPFRLLAFFSLIGLALASRAADPSRPNIVFIMADDLGYTDVACFGSKYYETPNIDRLATQGMRLTNYHQHQ